MLEVIINREFLQAAAVIVTVVYFLATIVGWISKERTIRALGGHAAIRRTYLPFGALSFALSPFYYSLLEIHLRSAKADKQA